MRTNFIFCAIEYRSDYFSDSFHTMEFQIEITKNVVMLGVLFICIGTLFACLVIIVICNIFCPDNEEDKSPGDIEIKDPRRPVISETNSTLFNEIDQ